MIFYSTVFSRDLDMDRSFSCYDLRILMKSICDYLCLLVMFELGRLHVTCDSLNMCISIIVFILCSSKFIRLIEDMIVFQISSIPVYTFSIVMCLSFIVQLF